MKRFLIISIALASWYSTEACKYNPDSSCPTASGKSLYALEKAGIEYAASWDYPFGTKLEVKNLKNGKKTIVTVFDRGPAKRLGRALDVSKLSAEKLGFLKEGLARVSIKEIKQ